MSKTIESFNLARKKLKIDNDDVVDRGDGLKLTFFLRTNQNHD